MKTATKQLPLFAASRPTALECSGSELAALLASLRGRGAVVLCMTVICTSRYRLTLGWPRRTPPPTGIKESVFESKLALETQLEQFPYEKRKNQPYTRAS